jgi:hypothetical protein
MPENAGSMSEYWQKLAAKLREGFEDEPEPTNRHPLDEQGPGVPRDQLGRISPTALQDSTKAVQAFGCSMAQAAQALQAVRLPNYRSSGAANYF